MNRALALIAAAAALALVGAAAIAGHGRERAALASPLPASDNAGPPGLAAAFTVLERRGAARLRAAGDPAPARGEVVLLVAPQAVLPGAEVEALLAHAARGGTVVWARGAGVQPALEAALGLAPVAGGDGGDAAVPLAPHPLTGGLVLPWGRGRGAAAVRSEEPGALAVSGTRDAAFAVSVPVGRGEVLVLAGPAPFENARLAEADALTLLLRLGAAGRVVFDERFLAPGAAGGRTGPALGLAMAQALLAALLVLAALAPRAGAVRPPPEDGAGRTTRDALASLAALYRRAGDEAELARGSWGTFRRSLERRTGIPARTPDADAARRLAPRHPGAAAALARGSGALARGGAGVLLAVTRAAADAAVDLSPSRTPAREHP